MLLMIYLYTFFNQNNLIVPNCPALKLLFLKKDNLVKNNVDNWASLT